MKKLQKPKVSVIMAVYNGMPYLKEAVKSILDQTFKDFEFIIIDDASTDGTQQYLKILKDRRIKIITNKKNLGLASSLNKALKLSKGEYIARMDADDISLPDRFKTQLEFLESHSAISLCGSWADLIDENGKVIGEKKYPTAGIEVKKALRWYQPIIHPTFMAKSKIYKELGGYDKNFDYAEDYEFLVRAMKKYKFANIPEKLLFWRQADNRRSRKSMRKVDVADFKVKLEILKSNYFGKTYIFYIAKKFITTFLIPTSLKITVSKKLKLA